jgi:hypothetical protein
MKKSDELTQEILQLQQRIRGIGGDIERNQPLPTPDYSAAASIGNDVGRWIRAGSGNGADFERENQRQHVRCEQLTVELRKLQDEVSRKSKARLAAIEEERKPAPPAVPVSPAMAELDARIRACSGEMTALRAERQDHMLGAAAGDKKALAVLERIAKDEDRAARLMLDLSEAKIALQSQEDEVRTEFAQREADAAHQRGREVCDRFIGWADELDALAQAFVAHFAKRTVLDRELRSTGATINYDVYSRLASSAVLQRAVCHAGMARLLGMDSMSGSAKAGDTFRALMKSAVVRPIVEKGRAA